MGCEGKRVPCSYLHKEKVADTLMKQARELMALTSQVEIEVRNVL